MSTIAFGVGVRMTGADVAAGRVNKFRVTTLQRMQKEADQHAKDAVTAIRALMQETYNSPGSGKAARSLSYKLSQSENGVSVQLTIGNFRELEFITELSGGTFHGGPYPILARSGKLLKFYWRRAGRVFIGPVVIHPGFRRDVLRDEGNRQMAIWADRMQRSFRNSVADVLLEI